MPDKTSRFKMNLVKGDEVFDVEPVNDNFKIIDSILFYVTDTGVIEHEGITWNYRRYSDKTIELSTTIDVSDPKPVWDADAKVSYSDLITINMPVAFEEVYYVGATTMFYGTYTRTYPSESTTEFISEERAGLFASNENAVKDAISFRLFSVTNMTDNPGAYSYSHKAAVNIKVKGVEV